MDSEGRLQFPKLSSVNYRSWSFTIRAVLASKDLIQYIDNRVVDLIDSRARELLVLTLLPPPATVTQTVKAPNDGTTPSASPTASTDAITAKAKKEVELSDTKARALIIVQLGTDQLSFVATAITAYN
jgi:hypothetical protein